MRKKGSQPSRRIASPNLMDGKERSEHVHGNSLALIIDKPILDMLQITADTPLELSTNGDQILVTPCRDKSRQKKLAASLKSINEKFADDLRKLAL